MQGPNVKRLIVRKMSLDLIPPGSAIDEGEGLGAAVRALMKPGNISRSVGLATAWVDEALAMVKAAPGNPYGDDDEAIAGEILRQIDERKRIAAEPASGP